MNIIINETLRAYIDPLTANEYAALERSLLAEGCRDALVLWGEVLIDGHNRHAICEKHGIAFKTVQNDSFADIEDVQLWMIDNHLARRSVSDFQRGVLALRKKDIVAARTKAAEDIAHADSPEAPATKPAQSREDTARTAGISSNAIVQIEKIRKTATPELVQAVRAGTISITAAAAVASLPENEQVAAVAGGRKELQQAARQVREQARSAKPPGKASAAEPGATGSHENELDALRREVAALRTENTTLNVDNITLRKQVEALNAMVAAARTPG